MRLMMDMINILRIFRITLGASWSKIFLAIGVFSYCLPGENLIRQASDFQQLASSFVCK